MKNSSKVQSAYRHGKKICAYCGIALPDQKDREREHVVARAFFDPHNIPSDIIIVASCKTCNHGDKSSLNDDEDYTASVMIANRFSSNHPVAKARLDEQGPFMSAVRKGKGGPAHLGRSMIWADIFTESGIWLGKRQGFPFDAPRVERVMEKIARGLHFHVTGEVVPAHFRGRVRLFIGPNGEPDKQTFAALMQLAGTEPKWERCPIQILGDNVFCYCAARDPDSNHSVWFLQFYNGSHQAMVTFH
ncbi:hypothetical protein [Armatimonas sp.]|uniref:hypothetical protein n=1 Tax=Armatimonas sp. TaxID=1872638 RepID=UPI00286A81E6|nr:hypothetical protein [Armatimonas sp.]